MKGKVKFSLAVLLLAVFTAAFAGEALAKPGWVTVKYTGASVERRRKNLKIDHKDYWCLVLKFDIINSSKNGDIMTAIYDRKISWNGNFTITKWQKNSGYEPGWGMKEWFPETWKNVKYGMTGTEPYKGEWFPGQVYKYTHYVTLAAIMNPGKSSWKTVNEAVARGFSFKLNKWSLDFQVQSRK